MIYGPLKRRLNLSYKEFSKTATGLGYNQGDAQDMFVNIFRAELSKGNSVNSILDNISLNIQRD